MLPEPVVSAAMSRYASSIGRNPMARALGRFHFDDPAGKAGAGGEGGGEQKQAKDDGKGGDDGGDGDDELDDAELEDAADDSDSIKALKKALRSERKQSRAKVRAAERKLTDHISRAESDKQAAEDAAATEQGKFKELAEKRGTDLEAAKSANATKDERLGEYAEIVTDLLKASWERIPEDTRSFYDGADDDPLAKAKFMARPAVQKAIADADKKDKPVDRGNPRNPKPAGGGNGEDDDAARKQNASRYFH